MTATVETVTAELATLTAVELRKLAAKHGIKGAAKGRKADLIPAIVAKIQEELPALPTEEVAQENKRRATAKKCEVCGKAKIDRKTQGADSTMCRDCFDAAGLENEHADGAHDDAPAYGCPDCPTDDAPVTDVIVLAHPKASKFANAAVAAGWAVTVTGHGSEDGKPSFTVEATKDGQRIELEWTAGKYNYYGHGSFHIDANDKKRFILNASQAHTYL
jgi:hypothetical protein